MRGKRHLWYGIVVDNLIDLEVKGILAGGNRPVYGHVKNGFQGTLAVADGMIGHALFLHTQGHSLASDRLYAVDAGPSDFILGQKFH